MADGAQIDFFISRAGADAALARQIDAILREAGYSTILQDWDFGHADFVAKMDDAIRRCRRIVTLLSHEYLASEYCGIEWRAAFAHDPRNFGQTVALLRVTECEPTGILCVYAYTDLMPILHNEDLLRDVVLARLNPARPATAQDAATPYRRDARPIVHPRIGPVENFTGREASFQSLDVALAAGQTVAVTQGAAGSSAKTAAVHGMGGVGKSALAREYVWCKRNDYAGVWWVNAESEAALVEDLVALGTLFIQDLDAAKDREAAARIALNRVLPATAKPWLLVFDNLESDKPLKDWTPRENARLIVTSRFSAYTASVHKIDIDTWPRSDSIAYLKAQSGRKDLNDAGANAIADALGDLPLALSHAAVYLRYNETVDAARYLDGVSRRMAEAPVDDKDGRSVYATFITALEAIEPQAPGATAIMRLSAFVAPTDIPEELFSQGAGLYPPDAQPLFSDPDRFAQAIGALNRYSLIRFRSDQRTFSQHRLVQATLQAMADPDDRWLVSTLAALSAAFPLVEFTNWPICRRLVMHAQAVMPSAERAIAAVPGIAAACSRLMSQAGYFLDRQARHREAEPLHRRSLAINAKSFGPDHPSTAISATNLAGSLEAANRLVEAESLYRQSLAIDEASFGPNHPSVARGLSNLASLLQKTNRLTEAEPLSRRSLAIAELSFGLYHPTVSLHLSNLAGLLQSTNRLAEAEPLFRRSLAINEAKFGPSHPTVASSLNNLANLLHETGRLTEAEPLMRRSLALDEASHGPSHPIVATRLNNLAELLRATNRLTEAEPLFRRALAINEASYWPEHPTVAGDLNNLALLLLEMNRLSEAEPLFRRALAINEVSFGPNHPTVARNLNNLAGLLRTTNRVIEAEPLHLRALTINEASYGSSHPYVALDLNNLALILQETDRLSEAEPLYRRALAIREASYGPDHPSVAGTLNNLGLLMQEMNRLPEAEPLYRRALAISEKSHGSNHPTVAKCLNNLAGLLQAMGQLSGAEPLYRRALEIAEASYGADHPEVGTCLNNLAGLLYSTNRLSEAEPLLRRALEIAEASYEPDHPAVVTSLINLAGLLEAANRLSEVEPLLKRLVVILIEALRRTGHEHPHLLAAIRNYVGLLQGMGRSEAEIAASLEMLGIAAATPSMQKPSI